MEAISVFDILKIGVGPSSSHTTGPWRAAQRFVAARRADGELERVCRVRVDLYGSLAQTGRGHGTDVAVLLGLAGEDPVTIDPESIFPTVAAIRSKRRLVLGGRRPVDWNESADLVFHRDESLPFHPNGLRFTALLDDGATIAETYYSVGGGFVVREGEPPGGEAAAVDLPLPIQSAADLLGHCRASGLTIPRVVRENERAWRIDSEIDDGLANLWRVMRH